MNVFVFCPLFMGTFLYFVVQAKKAISYGYVCQVKIVLFRRLSINNKKILNVTNNKEAGLPGYGTRRFKCRTEKGP